MNMNAINNLKYTGIVTLSQYIKNKKIPIMRVHNSGGSCLFNFFTNCLAGDFESARASVPGKIMLLKRTIQQNDNTQLTVLEPASGFLSLLTTPTRKLSSSQGDASAVVYSFIVPRDVLEAADFNGIGLYPMSALTSDYENYAAFAGISLGDTTFSTSSVLVVDWELSISNKNT